jgi:hypothetical protein
MPNALPQGPGAFLPPNKNRENEASSAAEAQGLVPRKPLALPIIELINKTPLAINRAN